MRITIDTEKLKKSIAYTDIDDLMYSIKRAAGFLQAHNKNLTKSQYNAAEMLNDFINAIDYEEE